MLLAIMVGLSVISAAGAAVSSGVHWFWVLPLAFAGSFLGLLILAFGFLVLVCAVVDKEKPQGKDSKFYRTVANLYIQLVISLARLHVHTKGLEQTPQSGRFMLVCNHLNNVDPALLLSCFPKSQLAFISKRENKDMFLVGSMMHRIRCQLINRENDREALKTILKCIQLLKDDEVSVGVFPEGYVSKDGKLQHLKAGVFKIAQKAQVPIVVCTIRNTKTVVPNLKKGKPSHVQVHLVGVIPAEELKGVTAVEIAQRVHEMMAADLGPELVAQE